MPGYVGELNSPSEAASGVPRVFVLGAVLRKYSAATTFRSGLSTSQAMAVSVGGAFVTVRLRANPLDDHGRHDPVLERNPSQGRRPSGRAGTGGRMAPVPGHVLDLEG